MPILATRKTTRKSQKIIDISWDNFRGGLNTLLNDTELDKNELAQATNIMLTGKGAPTKRWGTQTYFTAGATGSIRALGRYNTSGGTNELLTIGDEGFLRIKSGASYTQRLGFSWASGYNKEMTQLDDNMYIVSSQKPLVKYSSPTISSFPTIATPTGVIATQASGVSGAYRYSYRVSAISTNGETLASDIAEAINIPQDLKDGGVLVSWTAVSAASGDLQGYNVYGRNLSDERYMSFVSKDVTEFVDDGSIIPAEFSFPPTADTTGGVKAKFIERFQDRLIYAGLDGEPSKVIISGRVPFHEKNDITYGGNYIKIEPDAGEDITGLKVFRDKIIVFKENSVWQVTLSQIQVGEYYVTQPAATLLNDSKGCVSHRSIVPVENDLFFLNRDGLYVLGDEPNILNVLRTNELSAKIRPDVKNIGITVKNTACAFYSSFMYGVSFDQNDKTYVYDRERLAFVGPWTINANIYLVYYDSNDDRKLLFGATNEPVVYEMSEDYQTDDGTSFECSMLTKREEVKDWAGFKVLRQMYYLFDNVEGKINITLKAQDNFGEFKNIKSFTLESEIINSTSGWGYDLFGNTMFGDSEGDGSVTALAKFYRWNQLNETIRNYQIEVSQNDAGNFEVLQFKGVLHRAGSVIIPTSELI
jgi:hypothetical protein